MEDSIKDFTVYLLSERTLSLHTVDAYKRDILDCLSSFPSSLSEWKQVEAFHLTAFLKTKQENGAASSSIARALAALKTFFRFLVREDIIDKNPARFLHAPKVTQKIPHAPSVEEIEKILDQPDASSPEGARNVALIEVLYGCGLRVSELCGLSLSDIDDTFVRVKGKGGKERLVPIGKQAVEAIDRYLRFREGSSPWLFPGRGNKPITTATVRAICKKYAKQAGAKGTLSPHSFRHSFATHILQEGGDLRIIQEFLGHASINTTERYTQLDSDQLKEAFRRFHPRY